MNYTLKKLSYFLLLSSALYAPSAYSMDNKSYMEPFPLLPQEIQRHASLFGLENYLYGDFEHIFDMRTISPHKIATMKKTIALLGFENGQVCFINTMTDKRSFLTLFPYQSLCSLSTNGEIGLAASSGNSTVRVFTITPIQQEPLVELTHTAPVSQVVVSSNGQTAFTGLEDGTVCLWNIKPEVKKIIEIKAHDSRICAMVRDSSSRFGATACEDGTLKLWDIKNGASLELKGHTGCIQSLALSPDESTLSGGSSNGKAYVWDVYTGKLLLELSHPDQVDTQQKNSISSVAFSPNGTTLVTGTCSGAVHFWDASTGNFLGELKKHSTKITLIEFGVTGEDLLIGSEDGLTSLWKAQRESLFRNLWLGLSQADRS